MRISHLVVRLALFGTALSGLAHATPIVFNRGLPNSANVNGNPRSNIGWLSGTGTAPQAGDNIVGDDFSLNGSGSIDSITVYEIANNNINNTGGGASDHPGNEYSNITLYLGASGSPLNVASSVYTVSNASYQPGNIPYRSPSDGNFYEIWAITFSGLGFAVTTGTVYDFAVDATGVPGACATAPGGEPCIIALHASNNLSGTTQQGADGQYLNFTLGGGQATFAGGCNAACQNTQIPPGTTLPATDINVVITGTIVSPTPEPATLGTLGVSLVGLIALARKRRQ
jgi:hypothetical protein